MKKNWIGSLTLLLALLACTVTPAFAAEAAAPAQPVPAVETPVVCGQTADATAAPALADLFVPKPLQMDPPICNPNCIFSECTSNSQCTAQPGGRCVPACPHVGCCVY